MAFATSSGPGSERSGFLTRSITSDSSAAYASCWANFVSKLVLMPPGSTSLTRIPSGRSSNRSGLSKTLHSKLPGVVWREKGQTKAPRHGRHVDDGARLLLPHYRQYSSRHSRQSEEVRLKMILQLSTGIASKGPPMPNSRVVQQNINRAESSLCLIYGRRHRALISHVKLEDSRMRACAHEPMRPVSRAVAATFQSRLRKYWAAASPMPLEAPVMRMVFRIQPSYP